VGDVGRLSDEFEGLLRGIADGRAPIDDIEAWYQRHELALRACESLDLKSAVQRALVHTWCWRHGSTNDAEARASLRVLVRPRQRP
jgi:hypothetical protein